jgi:hypothetical protein
MSFIEPDSLSRDLGTAMEQCDFRHFGNPRRTDQASATMLFGRHFGRPPEMIKHMFDHREH